MLITLFGSYRMSTTNKGGVGQNSRTGGVIIVEGAGAEVAQGSLFRETN